MASYLGSREKDKLRVAVADRRGGASCDVIIIGDRGGLEEGKLLHHWAFRGGNRRFRQD